MEELEFSTNENLRQRKLTGAVFNSDDRLNGPDIQQLLVVVKEEVPHEQQEWCFSLDQDEPEPPHIKEEQEELWSSQEGEQLQGLEEADIKFTFTPVPIKSEDDDEESAQSSQLHQRQTEENREAEHLKTETDGEDCGGSEQARILDPDSPDEETSQSETETDDSRDWEETREPQSGLNLLQNSEVPVSAVECNTEKISVSSSKCAERFDHKGHLQKHTGIKTGEKPFSCFVCGKTFSRKYYLTTHMRLHSGEKRFSCSVCKLKINCRSNFVKHMRIHTGEKPFSCSQCGKRFTEMAHLRQHLNVHTGEKPFNCPFCSVRFVARGNLRRHMTVHTGEKPFICSICSKGFTQSRDLR